MRQCTYDSTSGKFPLRAAAYKTLQQKKRTVTKTETRKSSHINVFKVTIKVMYKIAQCLGLSVVESTNRGK